MKREEIYGWIKDLPIVDWHNHLDIGAIAEDRPFGSLYDVWVKPDPYKHRAMRICGEPERLITGEASDAEKMAAWERTLPKLVGNPLYAWSQMEMEFLKAHPLETLTPKKLLKLLNVEYASPCVGAGDAGKLKTVEDGKLKIAPSLRLNFGEKIPQETLERFDAAGCKVVDISADEPGALARETGTDELFAFAKRHGWTMLLHLGAMRATSARLRAAAGAAGGFAGMRAACDPEPVAQFLNALETRDALPRTILLTLNPMAHAQLAILSGSFVEDGVAGKVQLGPAWWWCDHEEGIRDVLDKSAAYGVLSTFVGMTTDSRSLLSFVRHDYFRRILCAWTEEKVASGAFPDDAALLRPMLENICYRNAKEMMK